VKQFLEQTRKTQTLFLNNFQTRQKSKYFLEWKNICKITYITVYSIVIKFLNYIKWKEQKDRKMVERPGDIIYKRGKGVLQRYVMQESEKNSDTSYTILRT